MIVLKISEATKIATDAFETASKRAIPKPAKVTGDLIDNKIAEKTMNKKRPCK